MVGVVYLKHGKAAAFQDTNSLCVNDGLEPFIAVQFRGISNRMVGYRVLQVLCRLVQCSAV